MSAPVEFPEFFVAWSALVSDLTLLIGDSISPGESKRGDPPPRIAHTLVSENQIGSFDGPSGLTMQRWQLNCFGKTPAEARLLARLVTGTKADRRLHGYAGTLAGLTVRKIWLIDSRDNFEQTMPGTDRVLPCKSLDFEVWFVPN